MAQSSVLSQQTTQTQQKKPFLFYRWMNYFFINEANSSSTDRFTIASLQRRAVWIALAILLQAANEVPFFVALSTLIPMALMLGSFCALWMALRPAKKQNQDAEQKASIARPRLWQRLVLIATLLVTIAGGVQCVLTVIECFAPLPQYSNDGTTLDTNAAILLVQGLNPYTNSNIPDLVRIFPITPNETTPLRQGQLANRLDYPSSAELVSILDTSLQSHKAANGAVSENKDVPEFEARVSYPALSFLTLLPFALVQNYNVMPFYLLCYILIVFVAWKSVRKELRPWVLVLAMANVPMWASTWGGNLDVLYTLFLIVSWLKRDMRWTSAIFLGLAIATKQIAWYFVPFYAIMALRHYGWRDTLYRLVIAGGIALIANLPFIMWDYQAWFAGIMAPIADPMFPMGVGLVSLSTGHFIPYLPEKLYSVLEYSGFALSLVTYWRTCKTRPESVMLFATMPLFLAWRSLSSYFYCVAFPAFILMTAHLKPATQKAFSFSYNKARESERVLVRV